MTHTVGSSARPDWPLAAVVGAGGMGMAVARRLGQTHRVLIADRDGDHAEARAAQLRAEGHDAAAIACDVTRRADIDRFAKAAADAGGVHALANVVGLSPALGDFATIMAVNIVGAAMVADAFLPVMAKGGAALFVASTAAHMQGVPDALAPLLDDPLAADFLPRITDELGADATPARAYVLSKQALIRMCQRHAPAWGAHGARIVSLSPGLIATPQGATEFRNSPGKYKLLEATPAAREGTMQEIANVAEFLLSDRASFISGTDILVDGGLIAALGTRRFG